MTVLPQPDDLTSLVLRTDFSDDAAWDALMAEIDNSDACRHATFVSDPAYEGTSIQTLIAVDAAASDEEALTYLFIADTTTMTDSEHPLLAVDLYNEPGRTFRVPPRWYGEVSANLTIANIGFDEFADSADATGTYRRFQ